MSWSLACSTARNVKGESSVLVKEYLFQMVLVMLCWAAFAAKINLSNIIYFSLEKLQHSIWPQDLRHCGKM